MNEQEKFERNFDIFECFGVEKNKAGIVTVFEKNGHLIKVPNPEADLKITDDNKMVAIRKGKYQIDMVSI